MLWDSFYLLSVVTVLTGAMLNGYLPSRLGAVLLIAAALFRAVAHARGGISDCAYRLFKVVFCGALIVVIVWRGGGADAVAVLLTSLVTGFDHLLVQILTLSALGHLSVVLAVLVIILLVVLRKLGLESLSLFVYHTFFRFAAPIFALLVLVARWSESDARQAMLIGGATLSLFLAAEGLFLIFSGAAQFVKKA